MARTTMILLGVSGLALAGSTPLLAAQAVPKILAENDKFQIVEIIEQPGDTGPVAVRFGHGVYLMSGGTFERTFADGTKQTTARKTGDAMIITEKRPYAVKNVGTTTAHLIEFWPKK
jgi:hypothetical protein